MTLPDDHAILASARLVLLPSQEALAEAAADFHRRNAAHLAPWDPPTPANFATVEAQRLRMQRAALEASAGTGLRWWLQARDQASRLIGSIGLSQIARGPFQNAMLGYAIDASFEGLGLMREALQAVIAHAFGSGLHLHRIQANVRPENRRSVALLRRLGFEEEGLAREYLYIDGAWRDHLMLALRNPDFIGEPR